MTKIIDFIGISEQESNHFLLVVYDPAPCNGEDVLDIPVNIYSF